MTVHDNVDVCVTCISDKPPALPLREELPSLGVELVYNSRGAGMRAVRRESRRKMRRMSARLERKVARENRKSAALGMKSARGSAKQEMLEEQLRALRTLEEEGTDDDTNSGGGKVGGKSNDYGVAAKQSPGTDKKQQGGSDTGKQAQAQARLAAALPAIVRMKMKARKMRKAVSYESYKKAAEKKAGEGGTGTDGGSSDDNATHATVEQSSSSSSSSGPVENSSSSSSTDSNLSSSSSIEEESSSVSSSDQEQEQPIKPSMSARSIRGLPALASPMSARSAPAAMSITVPRDSEGKETIRGGMTITLSKDYSVGRGGGGGPDDAAGRSPPSSPAFIQQLPPASPIRQLLEKRQRQQQQQQQQGAAAARSSSLPPWANSTWAEATSSPPSSPKQQSKQQIESASSPRPSPFSFFNFDVVGGGEDGSTKEGGQERSGGRTGSRSKSALSPGGAASGRWWYETFGDADTTSDGPVPLPLSALQQPRLGSSATDLECSTAGNYSTCTEGTFNATARPHSPSMVMGTGGSGSVGTLATTDGPSSPIAADNMMRLPYNAIIASGNDNANLGGIQGIQGPGQVSPDGEESYTLRECTFEVVEEWNNAFRAMCAMSTMLGNNSKDSGEEGSAGRAMQSFSEDEDMRRLRKRQERRILLQQQQAQQHAMHLQQMGQGQGQQGQFESSPEQLSPELLQGQQLGSGDGAAGGLLGSPQLLAAPALTDTSTAQDITKPPSMSSPHRGGPRSPRSAGQAGQGQGGGGFENELYAVLSHPDSTADDVKIVMDLNPSTVKSEVKSTGRSPLHYACDRIFPVRCIGTPMFPDVPPPTSPAAAAAAASSPAAASAEERPRSPLAAVVASIRKSASGSGGGGGGGSSSSSPRAFFGEGADTPKHDASNGGNSGRRGDVSLLSGSTPVASNVQARGGRRGGNNQDADVGGGGGGGGSSPIFSPVSLSSPTPRSGRPESLWPQTPLAPQTPNTPHYTPAFPDRDRDRSRHQVKDDVDAYLDSLIADAVNARVLLKLVTWSHVDAALMPDRSGDLPVHLLARRLAQWEDEWTGALGIYRSGSSGSRSAAARSEVEEEGQEGEGENKGDEDKHELDLVDEVRVSSLRRIVAQCVEVVLRPVSSHRALCRARGSAGVVLPLHIGAAFGVTYDTLRMLTEEYPEGARERCTAILPLIGTGTTSIPIHENTGGGGNSAGMIALELLERNFFLSGKSPAAVAEAEKEGTEGGGAAAAPGGSSSKGAAASKTSSAAAGGVKWTDSVLDSRGGQMGSTHDDFLSKSDLLFAVHPDAMPHRTDMARLRRLEKMVRNEAETKSKSRSKSKKAEEDEHAKKKTEMKMKIPAAIACGAGGVGAVGLSGSSQGQDDAIVGGRGRRRSALSPAAKSAWIYLCTRRADGTNPNDYKGGKDLGRGMYVDHVKSIVDGLGTAALYELTSVRVGGERFDLSLTGVGGDDEEEEGGRDLLEAAAPACADVIKEAAETARAKEEEEEKEEEERRRQLRLQQEQQQQQSQSQSLALVVSPSTVTVESGGRNPAGLACLALGAMAVDAAECMHMPAAAASSSSAATTKPSSSGGERRSKFGEKKKNKNKLTIDLPSPSSLLAASASASAHPHYYSACAPSTTTSSRAGDSTGGSLPKIAGAGGAAPSVASGTTAATAVDSSSGPEPLSIRTERTGTAAANANDQSPPSSSVASSQQARSILKRNGRVAAASARASASLRRESLGRLCRSVFRVHEGQDVPVAFVVLPYRLKVAAEEATPSGAADAQQHQQQQHPTLERPEDAELAVKFAEALLKITEAPAILYTLEEKFKRTAGRLSPVVGEGNKANESLTPEQREDVERTIEDFLGLFRFTGYLYLLDESNGMPRVPPPPSSTTPCSSPTNSVGSPTNSAASASASSFASVGSSSTARRRLRQPYPIMVTNASKNVRMLLPLMQMGMTLMRGDRAVKVLAESVTGGPTWLRSPCWVGAARDMVACTYSRTTAPLLASEAGGSGNGNNVAPSSPKGNGNLPLDGELRDRLFEYASSMTPSAQDGGALVAGGGDYEEDLQGTEWAMEVSLVRILLEKFDPKRTHAGLIPVSNEGKGMGERQRGQQGNSTTLWVYQPEGQGEGEDGSGSAAAAVGTPQARASAPPTPTPTPPLTYRDIRADVERELDSILQKSSVVAFDKSAATQDQQEASEMSASDVTASCSRDSLSTAPPTAATATHTRRDSGGGSSSAAQQPRGAVRSTPSSSLKGEGLELERSNHTRTTTAEEGEEDEDDDHDEDDLIATSTTPRKQPVMAVPDVVHTLSPVDESSEEKAQGGATGDNGDDGSSSTLDYSAGRRGSRRKYSGHGGDSLAYSASRYSGSRRSRRKDSDSEMIEDEDRGVRISSGEEVAAYRTKKSYETKKKSANDNEKGDVGNDLDTTHCDGKGVLSSPLSQPSPRRHQPYLRASIDLDLLEPDDDDDDDMVFAAAEAEMKELQLRIMNSIEEDQKRLAEACSSLDELKEAGLEGGVSPRTSPRGNNGLVAFWRAYSKEEDDDLLALDSDAMLPDDNNGDDDDNNQGEAVITAEQLLELTEEFRRKEALIKEKDAQISRLVEAIDAYNKEESEIMGEKDRIIKYLAGEVERFEQGEKYDGKKKEKATGSTADANDAACVENQGKNDVDDDDDEDDDESALAEQVDGAAAAGLLQASNNSNGDWKDSDDGIDLIMALSNSTEDMKMSEEVKVNLMMKLYALEQKLLEKEMELEEVKLALHARELEMVREKDEEIRELRKKLREQEYSKRTTTGTTGQEGNRSQGSGVTSGTFVTARTRETADTFVTARTTAVAEGEEKEAEQGQGGAHGIKLHID